ncbi:unnamed protein product [Coregonus sp. 'balchen']|nr:unnamed protein product [Coregonus sp. 'balchen']
MATEFTISESAVPLSEPHQVEDEEHWLYGGENTKKQNAPEGLPGDSDDDDDVKVTIGNIKTGAPSYIGTGMNLSLKPARGYVSAAAIKLQPKGIDIETLGAFNGAPVVEVEMDIFEDKPWRKPGADLSDYFNYGFNEETWKGYCERQRRLQLGLEPSASLSFQNKITVQQGRVTTLEKDTEPSSIKPDYKPDFPSASVLALAANRLKAGPPPNRKLGGTIDVIGGQTGAIRRVEGRRREMQEQNPIQVLGDHGNKIQPLVPPAGPPPPLPLPMGMPPPHFLHPPPPVSGMPPPLHPPGLFPPPLAPPPTLMMPPVDSGGMYGGYLAVNAVYFLSEPSFINYPPVSSSHMPWGSVLEKGGGEDGGRGHWEYQGGHRERDRERDQERDHTPTTSEYNEDDRYHYYSHDRESEREFERSYLHVHDSSGERSREREEHQRDRRHRDKEESGKHKSSKRKQHDDEGEVHRRHKHKKSKRSKEDKDDPEDMVGRGEEHKD